MNDLTVAVRNWPEWRHAASAFAQAGYLCTETFSSLLKTHSLSSFPCLCTRAFSSLLKTHSLSSSVPFSLYFPPSSTISRPFLPHSSFLSSTKFPKQWKALLFLLLLLPWLVSFFPCSSYLVVFLWLLIMFLLLGIPKLA